MNDDDMTKFDWVALIAAILIALVGAAIILGDPFIRKFILSLV